MPDKPKIPSPPEWLKEWPSLLTSLGIPIGGVWVAVAWLWKSTQVEVQVSIRLLLVTGAGFVSLVSILAWRLVESRRRKCFQDDYSFNRNTGFFTHKRTGDICCPTCVHEEHRSPMKESTDGWRCTRDRHFFEKEIDF